MLFGAIMVSFCKWSLYITWKLKKHTLATTQFSLVVYLSELDYTVLSIHSSFLTVHQFYNFTLIFIAVPHSCCYVKGRFKTQPAVDRPEPPVPSSCYCSEQWQPAGTAGSWQSTTGLVLKPSLSTKSCQISNEILLSLIVELNIGCQVMRQFFYYGKVRIRNKM